MTFSLTAFFLKPGRTYLFLCLAGAISAVGFAPWNLWLINIVALAFLCRFFMTGITPRQGLAGGFSFGFGQGAVSMSWLINALMIDSGQFLVFAPLVPIGMGILFGVFFALPACIAALAQTNVKKVIAFAGALGFFEWMRSWFLTGFPWNLTGSVFMEQDALLQSAAVVGVYGLSVWAALIAGAIALLPQIKPLIAVLTITAILETAGAVRLWNADETKVWGVNLRLVQPNIEQSLKWDPQKADEHFSTLIRLSKENNELVTHVIWPESAVDFPVNTAHGERVRAMAAVRQGGVLIMGGLKIKQTKPLQVANSVFVLNDLGDITADYDKSHLVPFGEYVPFATWMPMRKIVPIGPDFAQGNGVRTVRVEKAPPAGMLVCYEIIFSGAVTDRVHRPAWLINVTNDAWYGQSAGPYQHFAMARLRAVEEGLPVVRVANSGISAVIDPYGRASQKLALGTQGVLDSPLPTALPPTFYAQTGPTPVVLICLVLILFSLKKRK